MINDHLSSVPEADMTVEQLAFRRNAYINQRDQLTRKGSDRMKVVEASQNIQRIEALLQSKMGAQHG